MKRKNLIIAAFLLLVLCSAGSVRGQGVAGTWIGEFRQQSWGGVSESLWMTMRARAGSERHGFNFSLDLKDLEGLGIAMGHNGKSAVTFSLNREAGNFDFEGQFVDDAGSGTFTFSTNPHYIDQMGRLGYRSLDEGQLLMLAIHNVTTSFVEELEALGFEDLSYDKLLASVIHGLTPSYVRTLQAHGYAGLDHDRFIAMRIHGVSVDYIEEMATLGYKYIDYEDLMAMRIHGVSPDYVDALAELGYKDIPISKLVAMRIHGVSTSYVEEVLEAGYSPEIDRLVEMRIHGVSVRMLKAANTP